MPWYLSLLVSIFVSAVITVIFNVNYIRSEKKKAKMEAEKLLSSFDEKDDLIGEEPFGNKEGEV